MDPGSGEIVNPALSLFKNILYFPFCLCLSVLTELKITLLILKTEIYI